LKTIGGAKMTRSAGLPQTWQRCRALALKLSRFSYWWPAEQRYSYVGTMVSSRWNLKQF
jgi:hypothetical protein